MSSSSTLSSLTRNAGLISGLDTESLVKAMAANTKNKLNSKKQKLQVLQWKQESYRSSISKVTAFQDKYLTITSDSSIKANAIMKKFSSESSDSKVVASASSSSIEATYSISKATSAKAAEFTSSGSVCTNKVELDFSKNTEGKSYTVKVTLDGTTRDVTFEGGADEQASKTNFLTALNSSVSTLKYDNQGFEFNEGTNELVFNNAGDSYYHTFSVGYGSEAVGLENTATSNITTASRLGDISFITELSTTDADGKYKMNINGVDFEFDKNTSVSSMINTINKSKAGVKMTFNSVSQGFKLESTKTGTEGSISIEQTSGNLANALFNNADVSQSVYGTNGSITISAGDGNYVTYTSASNSYTFDGTNINIAKLGDFDSAAEGVEEITIKTEKDTAGIKDAVVNFVNDYNTLLADLYKTVNTARPKSKGAYYEPLTEEQEEEMENDEIEKWNDQAKEGLLYHDSNLTRLISSMRTAMTTSFKGFSLTDMGIEVSSDLTEHGKLNINTEKLESAIKNYGDEIADLFTDTENGLGAKLTSTLDKAVSKTVNNYGYLTQLAGIENTTSETKNTMYSQISSLQTMIKNLEDKYDNEMERYWKKFTTLETYMSQMQSQSSIFATE